MSNYLLFEQDWQLFPTAIVDYETSNTSFIEVCALFKQMGIKNHLFPLTLLNPSLQGIDPFREDLDEQTQTLIKLECKWNPWYFIREVLRIPPPAGNTPIPLIANRANISLWWCFLNHIDYFLIQPRQTGKSVNSDGIHNWYGIFGADNTRSNLFTKDADLIKENIARLKKIRNLLPKYLVHLTKEDTDNQKEFTNLAQGNRLVATQAQANEDAARNVGRGLTAPMTHTDEVAFLRFVHISIPAMLAGAGAAREVAAQYGVPFGNIFTTTAGKLDSVEGEFAYTMLQEGMPWTERLYDCKDVKELYRTVAAGCKTDSLLINGTFSHRQLGFTDDWLRGRIAAAKQKGDEARRDFLNEWTSGSLSNPLSTEVLGKIKASEREPDYIQHYANTGYMVNWYYPESVVAEKFKGRMLVMGLDTSNATGRDSITGVIGDVSTLEVVGRFSLNETNLLVFSGWFAKFLLEYQNIVVVPENKSTWVAIQDYLLIHLPMLGIDPGRRIYSQVVDNRHNSERDRRVYEEFSHASTMRNHYSGYRKFFGFPTNGPLRELLTTVVLQEAGKKTAEVTRDKALIAEICGLVTKNGRVDHQSGKHDDHVFSWLLMHWFLTYAKNLEHYGIDPAMVKKKVYERAAKLSWREERERERQLIYREEIEEIVREMGDTHDEFILMRLEHRLESLYRKIDHDLLDQDIGSIDALINEARERRSVNSRKRITHEDIPESPLYGASKSYGWRPRSRGTVVEC